MSADSLAISGELKSADLQSRIEAEQGPEVGPHESTISRIAGQRERDTQSVEVCEVARIRGVP